MSNKIVLARIETRPASVRLYNNIGDNLTLSLLAAQLRKNGYEVGLYTNFGKFDNATDLDEIIDGSIKLIGFSINVSNAEKSLSVSKRLKQLHPKLSIVYGGPHVDNIFGSFLLGDNPHVDFAVIGQGEKTLSELVNVLDTGLDTSQVNGLVYRSNGQVIKTKPRQSLTPEELSDLALPATDLIENIPLEERANKMVQLRTSIGCNAFCSFCYVQKGNWVPASSGAVLKTFEQYLQMGFRRFLIVDDNFVGTDPERVKKIGIGLIELGKEYSKFKFQIDCRTDSLGTYKTGFRHDVVEILVEAGLEDVFIGFDSGNDEDLSMFHKSTDKGISMLEQNKFFLKEMEKYKDVTVTPGFIMLHRETKIEQIRRNIEIIAEYLRPQFSPEIYWYHLSYYPGSSMTKKEVFFIQNSNCSEEEKRSKMRDIFFGRYNYTFLDQSVGNFSKILRNCRQVFFDVENLLFALEPAERLDFLRYKGTELKELHLTYFNKYIQLASAPVLDHNFTKVVEEHRNKLIQILEEYKCGGS